MKARDVLREVLSGPADDGEGLEAPDQDASTRNRSQLLKQINKNTVRKVLELIGNESVRLLTLGLVSLCGLLGLIESV